ncbi:hypothetical protein GCM10027614_26560 [Micromonospora vulcania]
MAVRTPDPVALTSLLTAQGGAVRPEGDALAVTGLTAAQVGELACAHRVPLHELLTRTASLEEAFMELTADSVDYPAGGPR